MTEARARPNIWRSVIMFLSIVGPGIITANADNDVGGIFTYSQAGAQFGYSLLWILVPITIALIVVQEMCARMGAITGKGLADLIRENFGVKVTFWCLLLFVLGGIGNTATEFAGVAATAPIFGSYLHVGNAEGFRDRAGRRRGGLRLPHGDARQREGDRARLFGFLRRLRSLHRQRVRRPSGLGHRAPPEPRAAHRRRRRRTC